MSDDVHAFDWSRTPLGPMEAWPAVLVEAVCQTVSSMAGAHRPAAPPDRFSALCMDVDQSFCIIELIFDAAGVAADCRFLQVNDAPSGGLAVRTSSAGRCAPSTPCRPCCGSMPLPVWLGPAFRNGWTGRSPKAGARSKRMPSGSGRAPRGRWGVLCRGIGRQRQADGELKESSESLSLIVENARNYAIFATDPQGLITAWYAGAGASAPNFWNAR